MKWQRRFNITLTTTLTTAFILLGTQDYTLYEKIVASLNLTENMRIALECRQNGLSYPEIGRVLSRAQATVYEYFIKMRKRYMAIYG